MSSYRKPSWEPKAEIQMRNKGGWHVSQHWVETNRQIWDIF